MSGGLELESLVDQQISVITDDGRNIVGVLKAFDQATNIILDESHERVYSTKLGTTKMVGNFAVPNRELSWCDRLLQHVMPGHSLNFFKKFTDTVLHKSYVNEAIREVSKDEEGVTSADDGARKGGVFSSCAQVWENHSDEDFDNDANNAGDDEEEELYDSSFTAKLQFRRNDMWRARWDEDMSMAEVLKNKGKMAITTGVIREGKLFCSMEETLFLRERGALSLLVPEDASPLKDMYKRISEKTSGCNWELFEAYRHLKSLGYIVGRNGVPWTAKTKKNLNLSEAAITENKCLNDGLEHDLSALSMDDNTYSNELKPDFDVYLPNSKFKKSSPGVPNFKVYVCRGHPPSKHDIEILESKCGDIPLKICHVDHGRVSYLSFDKARLPELP